MNTTKLTRKLYLQWYILKLCKSYPHTFEEIYKTLQQDILLPPASKGTTPASPTAKPTHSEAYVRSRYIKELISLGYLIQADNAYSITKSGYQAETSLRLNLKDRLKVLFLAVEKMHNDLKGIRDHREVQIVAEPDREFLRGAISIKDMVRYFALYKLTKRKEDSIANLRKEMLKTYGWTCSREYFYKLVRDELGDQKELSEEHKHDIDENLSRCVVGEWKGVRRNKRYFRITNKGREWLETFRQAALNDLVEAKKYLANLIQLLDK